MYYYGDKIRDDEMGGTHNTHGKDDECKFLVRKPKQKSQLGRSQCRRGIILKIYLKEIRV
jgi:hypothetical protein